MLEEGDGVLPEPNGLRPLDVARSLLGAPYAWGGLSASGIDCSGLVHLAYRLTGRLVARDAWQQEHAGTRLTEPEMAAGDLLTFGTVDRASHIAFWIGDGWILHATGRNGLGVIEEREPAALRASRRMSIRL